MVDLSALRFLTASVLEAKRKLEEEEEEEKVAKKVKVKEEEMDRKTDWTDPGWLGLATDSSGAQHRWLRLTHRSGWTLPSIL